MKIYIDESGDFNFNNGSYVSVIASVVVPENKDYKLETFFVKLKKKISLKEKDDNGEIKGCLLNSQNLKFTFEFLSRNLDFRITLAIFDHKSSTSEDIYEHRIGQAERFQRGKDYYLMGPVKAKSVLDFFDEKKRWAERSDLISDTIRHSFATNLMKKGVSLGHIQVLLGHSDIQNTSRHYLGILCDDEAKEAHRKGMDMGKWI